MIVVWLSALSSAFVDNIPFTATMIPVIDSLNHNPMIASTFDSFQISPLWWALSLGANFGGNGTLIILPVLKVKYVSIFAVVILAVLSGVPVLTSGKVNYAYDRYATNTQTQANNNECTSGTNCAITSPQTQGDGMANSPTNLQISKFNEEQEEQDGAVGEIDEIILPPGDRVLVRGECDDGPLAMRVIVSPCTVLVSP